VEDYIFTSKGVKRLIEDLTEACQEAGDQKSEVEGDDPSLIDKVEDEARQVMSHFDNMPMYDAVMILTSCLVRVLNDALDMNALGDEFGPLDGKDH
jgi:hypothetical protein